MPRLAWRIHFEIDSVRQGEASGWRKKREAEESVIQDQAMVSQAYGLSRIVHILLLGLG